MRTPDPLPASLQDLFLSLVPKIEIYGRIFFRHLRCVHQRQEAIAEMIGLTWKWFLRLSERGQDASQFPSALARFAARAVQGGRRLCGIDPAQDVLSQRAQQRQHFCTGSLREGASLSGDLLEEALHDNSQTPVPEQVVFRLDFPAWLRTRSERDRRLALDLMRGERTLDVSRKYGTSPARISRLRREFYEDWNQFCSD